MRIKIEVRSKYESHQNFIGQAVFVNLNVYTKKANLKNVSSLGEAINDYDNYK